MAQVVYPLITLLEKPDDHPVHILAEFSRRQSLKQTVSWITMSDPAPKKRQKKGDSGELSVRQCYQEMRNMMDSLTSESLLSNGTKVGDFLVAQWVEKEKKKK